LEEYVRSKRTGGKVSSGADVTSALDIKFTISYNEIELKEKVYGGYVLTNYRVY